MLSIYKGFQKLLQFFINFLFVIQITLMILIFLTATYWFLDLIDIHFFDFVQPIAASISDFVKIFYNNEVQVGGIYIDGSLLLFDLIAGVAVFLITKLKYYIYLLIDSVNLQINKCNKKIEAKFNKKLQENAEANIRKSNNVAILVQFSAKNMMVDSCWGGDQEIGVKEKEEEAFKVFYASIKNISNCKFAKTGDKMLIMLYDFNSVDNLLNFIDLSVNRLRLNMESKKWLLNAYISVDVFNNTTNFKQDVYPILEKLLTLKIKNEAVCLGNFCLRYELFAEPMYSPMLRGTYDINGQCDVWSLVKKL